MPKRSFDWRKYGRFGGFLLAFVLFAPVVVGFFGATISLLSKRSQPSVMMTGERVPAAPEMMDTIGDSGGPGKMWRKGMDMATSNVAMMAPSRSITKGASLDMRAESLEWTTGEIRSVVERVGGYVENLNISQPLYGVRTAWMTARVPADRLEVTLTDVKKTVSSVTGENLYAGDVTDRSIDLVARLNAKSAEEETLVSLLDRAEKVSDVIEVTERLSLVRSEIESMEAEQRMLESQVSLASVSMSITEEPRIVVDTSAVRGDNVVKQAVTDVARWGIALGSVLVAFLISGVPVIVIYGFFLWLFYRFGRYVANKLISHKK